jgi:hypothetical protein
MNRRRTDSENLDRLARIADRNQVLPSGLPMVSPDESMGL